MCLGIPGRIVEIPIDQPDLGRVEVEGVLRGINLSLLAEEAPVPGDWVLIHLGFALQKITEAEVAEMRATRAVLYGGADAPVGSLVTGGDAVAAPLDRAAS
jgi:hydrogenase expression/formation protein HypC